MALAIRCPSCGEKTRYEEPYPLPGSERQCVCGKALAISYPVGLVELLRSRGALFDGDDARPAPPPPPRRAPLPDPTASHAAVPPRPPAVRSVEPRAPAPEPTAPVPEVRPIRMAAATPTAPVPDVRPVHRAPPDPGAAGPRPSPRRVAPPPIAPVPSTRDDDRTLLERRQEAAEPTVAARAPDPRLPDRRPPLPPPPNATVRTEKLPPRRATPPPPARRGWLWWTGRLFAFGTLAAVTVVVAVGGGALGVIWKYSQELPSVDVLGAYKPPTVTTVYDQNHNLVGELYKNRRYVVPIDKIPAVVKNAFIAAEDGGFYTHKGVDTLGIIRAVVVNTLQGRKAQGASTITQQVARNFLLSNEKTYERKIREMLLAQRIEETFTKDQILYLYLNEIYLGSNGYGVEGAARVYFDKHVEDLNLAEAALLAGLPQRPSDYDPHKNFQKAKERQSYVLGQMLENGMITQAEHDSAITAPIDIVQRSNPFNRKAPWFAEHVRRYLIEKYGEDLVYNQGLSVETTCDLRLQEVAQAAVTGGAQDLDETKGWRGPVETLDEAAIAPKIAELKKKNDMLVEGERYLGVVVEVQQKHVIVDLGAQQALVPLSWAKWARAKGKGSLDDFRKTLKRGDVVKVELIAADYKKIKDLESYTAAGTGPLAAADLFQLPEVEAALYSYRMSDGAVVAMIGGVDFLDTQFNRAIQSQRQVGSTFKPIVYAAAIASRQYTPATIIPDAPIVFETGAGSWKPENYGGDYLGNITLRKALALSRNVVTVRVLDGLGVGNVYKMARQLGIQSDMLQDLSLGLGAASLNMPELSRAYSVFATNGKLVEPHYITRVTDRDGNVLEEWKRPNAWPQALDPSVATVMNWMLTEVTTVGTAAKAASLGIHVAGKTGTTNDNKDAWFVGFTPDLLTTVWVGYDTPRSLGGSATGGYTALPIWMDYMKVAAPKATDRPFPQGPVDWYGVNEATGSRSDGGRQMPFVPGTSPPVGGGGEGETTSQDLLTTEF